MSKKATKKVAASASTGDVQKMLGRPEKKGQSKPPKGTADNPHLLKPDAFYLDDLKEGLSEGFVLEVMYETQGKRKPFWEDYDDNSTFPTLARAVKEAKDARASEVRVVRDQFERQWHAENMHNQQSKQLIQFAVTAKTTKKDIEAMVAQVEEAKKKMKDNPPAKKPKFEEPEYPKFRVVRRRYLFKSEVVEVME